MIYGSVFQVNPAFLKKDETLLKKSAFGSWLLGSFFRQSSVTSHQ